MENRANFKAKLEDKIRGLSPFLNIKMPNMGILINNENNMTENKRSRFGLNMDIGR